MDCSNLTDKYKIMVHLKMDDKLKCVMHTHVYIYLKDELEICAG